MFFLFYTQLLVLNDKNILPIYHHKAVAVLKRIILKKYGVKLYNFDLWATT